MPTILNLIGMLIAGSGKGANSIKTMAAPYARDYLALLVRLAWKGTLIPLGIAAIGILGGMTDWKPGLWSNIIALGGLVSFLYLGLLGALASPIGALIGAALPGGQQPIRTQPEKVTWKSLLSPDWIVRLIREAGQWASDQFREGVERYFALVRKVLAWEVFIFFFVAAAPALRDAVFILILGVAGIAVSQKFSEKWVRVGLRITTAALMLWWIAGSAFPALNPFSYYFGTTAKELTFGGVVTAVDTHWKWDKPGVWIAVAVAALLAYILIRIFRKAPAGAGGSPGSSSQGSSRSWGTGWLGKAVMVAVMLLCLAWGYKHVRGAHEEHNARIASQLNEARTYETMRATLRATAETARKAAAAAVPQTTIAATPPQPEIWQGLKNPQKYPLTLSTNLSERIPRPEGFSTRVEPQLRAEFWANGVRVPEIPGMPTPIPPGTTYVQYRWTNSFPTNVVVGVGRER